MSDIEQELADEMGDDSGDQIGDDLEQAAGDDLEQDSTELAAPEPAVRSQKEIEDLQGKLEREAERHAKRVAEIMGDDFALLVPNPTDWTPGFLFNVPEMLPFPEQVAAFDAIIGRGGITEYLDAEDAERCVKCNGKGSVRTHSDVPGQELKPCSKCNGAGWVGVLPPLAPVTQFQNAPNVSPGQPVTPDTYQVKDSWGRPATHPHFGVDPVTITA